MDPRDGLPAVKITCPYTTQNCPLFAPSFSLESVQPVSHLPQVRKDADDGQQREHQEPTEQRHEQDQGQQHQFTALPPIRTRAEHPEARSSGATTTQQTSPAQQLSLPSLRLPSLDYSDYSLAPSPAPSASTSSSALARPSEFYTSQPRQLPPYFPHRYSPPPVEQQRPQAGSATTTSLHRGFQWGESGGPSRGGEAREGAAEGEESTGIYGSRGGRRYSLLHLGGATSPAAEEGARAEGRPSSAMREEQEQGQHGGQGSSGGEGYYAEGQGAGHPAPSGNGSASMAASPSLSGEDEVAEGPQSEMITPFISSELLSLIFPLILTSLIILCAAELVHLLSHRDFREVIRWTDAGDAFVFAHTSPVLLDVFARFFRHSNLSCALFLFSRIKADCRLFLPPSRCTPSFVS